MPRRPSRLVKIVRTVAPWSRLVAVAARAGLSVREAISVRAYLSERKSHCTPLNSGLEKVIGVNVVLSCSPTVNAMWYWPCEAVEMTRLLNQLLNSTDLSIALPVSVGCCCAHS